MRIRAPVFGISFGVTLVTEVRAVEWQPLRSWAGKRALVYDAGAITRDYLQRLLTRAGFCVVGQAATAEELKDAIALQRPDLVLLDTDMPDVDAGGILWFIRTCSSACLVVLTAVMGDEHERQLRLAGAHAVIAKPTNSRELIGSLKQTWTQTRGSLLRNRVVADSLVPASEIGPSAGRLMGVIERAAAAWERAQMQSDRLASLLVSAQSVQEAARSLRLQCTTERARIGHLRLGAPECTC